MHAVGERRLQWTSLSLMLVHMCCNTRRPLHPVVQELGHVRTAGERFKICWGRQGMLAKATQGL